MTPEELDKIKKEIELLEIELKLKRSKWNRLAAWSGWIAAIVLLISNSFGVFQSMVTYYDKRAEQTEFNLNQGIITLVTDKNVELEQRIKIITLLSYYEYNSLPTLIYFLERDKNRDVRNAVVESLKRILRNSRRKDAIINELSNSFLLFLGRVKEKTEFPIYVTYLRLFQDEGMNKFMNKEQTTFVQDSLRSFKINKFANDSVIYLDFYNDLTEEQIKKIGRKK